MDVGETVAPSAGFQTGTATIDTATKDPGIPTEEVIGTMIEIATNVLHHTVMTTVHGGMTPEIEETVNLMTIISADHVTENIAVMKMIHIDPETTRTCIDLEVTTVMTHAVTIIAAVNKSAVEVVAAAALDVIDRGADTVIHPTPPLHLQAAAVVASALAGRWYGRTS
jgi:hypothetical protein